MPIKGEGGIDAESPHDFKTDTVNKGKLLSTGGHDGEHACIMSGFVNPFDIHCWKDIADEPFDSFQPQASLKNCACLQNHIVGSDKTNVVAKEVNIRLPGNVVHEFVGIKKRYDS